MLDVHRAHLRMFARTLIAGEATIHSVQERITKLLGRPRRWIPRLASAYVAHFAPGTRPSLRQALRFLQEHPTVRRLRTRAPSQWKVAHWLLDPAQMVPAPVARSWKIPAITSPGALAEWLQVEPAQLDWLADWKGLNTQRGEMRLRHCHYRLLTKDSGSVRLIEAPKPELKRIQRQILSGILEQVPAHPAVHGFVKGCSIQTFAAPHTAQRVVLRMDLQNFFPTFSGARVQSVFRLLGYPDSVANLLAGLCSTETPPDIWASATLAPGELYALRMLYGARHLAQGAPTSPALANICTFRIDCRLPSLAHAASAEYTRYADDLAFSGGAAFERVIDRFSIHVAALMSEEGFAVHHRKTRIMRRGVRQYLAGLVTNDRLNVPRPDFDRLKATLTNCALFGPESQNREASAHFRLQLAGRVAFVESVNAAKGLRLRRIFDRIVWPAAL